jgi:[protein-PII] uridylyltransferase
MNRALAIAEVDENSVSLTAATQQLAAEYLDNDKRQLNWARLEPAVADPDADLTQLRHIYSCCSATLIQLFLDGIPSGQLVRDRARLVDNLIRAAWKRRAAAQLPDTALVAVGGYGRSELHPYSDVDLLILLDQPSSDGGADAIAGFLALLWDLGLEVGHSTRTLDDCLAACRDDLSAVTTLMESRWLSGPAETVAAMQTIIGPQNIWSDRSYFEAKLKEQQARHARYGDTAYNLEPNVKGSPGGLRDIQTIVWVARRHFGSRDLRALLARGFLTEAQLSLLEEGRELLWRIRFALHVLTGRREDRLLFDHQIRLAKLFGYRDGNYVLAVEQFMQRYYRTVKELSRLNEMLLQRFQEVILMNPEATPEQINERFQSRNGFLILADSGVFRRNPSAILEAFLILQQHQEIKGMSAATITAIKRDMHLINDEFRQDPRNQNLFMQILSATEGVTHELRRMNDYGVLGSYIPAFGRIVGRMQYDLFHAYTVDEHTLFVVSNLRRFALSRFDQEYPRCSEIMQSLPKPEVVYLAGLFHDIAKGRGGDHSELGAVDAESFCLEHGLSQYDARLVAWLVRNHLLLSLTAQKKDLGDPQVIKEFAEAVGDEAHLDYLYMLTVADVRATNPKLWNSWRAQLFEELRSLTLRALRRGLENPLDRQQLLTDRQSEARELLRQENLEESSINAAWARLSEDYFLRCRPKEIAAHTVMLADPQSADKNILVDLREQFSGAGTAVFLFTPQRLFTFAMATAVMDELGFSIADARIVQLPNERSLSTFVLLEADGSAISEPTRLVQLRRRLIAAMEDGSDASLTVTRRAPRQVRMFTTATLVSFGLDSRNQRTVIEIVSGDRPGLLSEIGQILRKHKVSIETAKIMTVGERAEDVFYVTDSKGGALDDAACDQLADALLSSLNQPG